MKKLFITGIVLYFGMINAQIVLTKDASFGTNGAFTYTDDGGHRAHQFIGDKLLICYTYLNIGGNNKYSKFIRLNSNGTLDTSFGNNGSFVDSGSLGMESNLTDANLDYLINVSDSKYFSNGQNDQAFQNNWNNNNIWGKKYLKILADGNILFRKDDNFTKISSSGALITSYGNGGRLSTLSYSNDFGNGRIVNNFAYEFGGSENNSTNGIRRINLSTGTLDAGYGNSGLGQTSIVPTTVRNSMYHEGDNSLLNMLNGDSSNGNQYLISKTTSTGFLDQSFGTNGVFTLNKEINGVEYRYYHKFYADNLNRIFFLMRAEDEGVDISCYSSSGALKNINNGSVFRTGDNVYENYAMGDAPDFEVVDNYLYFFGAKKVTRYIISESSLNTTKAVVDKKSINFKNPFKDELMVNAPENMKSIEVIDENGRVILTAKDSRRINTSGLSKGVYLIRMTTKSNEVITRKAIKN